MVEDVKQKFSKVKSIPISEIKIRKEIFQGRAEAYSKSTYEKIMREGFDKSQEPLIVWKDKARDEYVVISGHSRLAAAQDLYNAGQEDLAVLNVKEFLGTKDEAIEYALLESNRSGTAEGLISDVKAYKKAASTGCNKECLKGYFKTDSYINTLERLSNLNIEGDFLQNLNDPTQAKLYPKLQQYAEWTGELRKHYTKITDRHENEIFKFVFLEVGKILPKQDFTDMITKVVNNFAFNPNNPLNLNKAQEKSIFQADASESTQILETETLELKNILEKKHKAYARSENKVTLDLLWTEIIGANQQIIKKYKQINNIKGDVKEAENSSLDLFATNTETPAFSFEKEEEKKEAAPTTATKFTPDSAVVEKEASKTKSAGNNPQTIAELVAWVKDNPKSNELKSVVYSVVEDVQAAAIEKATNIDISGFERVLDSYGIKHILKNHGGASEELRGQEPITLEDFKKIPDVVENYDKVFGGVLSKRNKLPMIAYVKRTNGVILIVEEQRESKKKSTKKVPVLTMMKFKVGEKKSPEELMLSIQKAYTQDTSPTLTSETFPGHTKVTEKPESTKEKPKLSIAERIDALKELSKYANETTKKGLSARIKILKELLKYRK